MSTVVYLRVPDALKQALEVRARERGLSLTAAVVALLERGLDTSEGERAREKKVSSRLSPQSSSEREPALSRPKPRLRSPENESS